MWTKIFEISSFVGSYSNRSHLNVVNYTGISVFYPQVCKSWSVGSASKAHTHQVTCEVTLAT